MRKLRIWGHVATSLATVALVLAPTVRVEAEHPLPADRPLAQVLDVALDAEQMLHGQVVNPSAVAVQQGQALLLRDGVTIGLVQADLEGRFAIRLTQGGLYQMATDHEVVSFRAWTAGAAPPRAQRAIVLTAGDVTRGQQGQIPFVRHSPWVIVGVVAAAVAIPIVLHNHRNDRGDGS